MGFYKLNEDFKNKKFKVNLASREKVLSYYRNNYRRICFENIKLQEEIKELKEKIREFEIGRLGE